MAATTEGMLMAKKVKEFDVYTFVADAALATGKPFQLKCNCGGVVTIMPPFQDEYVICASCEARIRILAVEGDPGYIIGADVGGNPILLPVQGSSHPHPNQLPAEKREAILAEVRDEIRKKTT